MKMSYQLYYVRTYTLTSYFHNYSSAFINEKIFNALKGKKWEEQNVKVKDDTFEKGQLATFITHLPKTENITTDGQVTQTGSVTSSREPWGVCGLGS